MEESGSRQESNVLPAGRPAALRRHPPGGLVAAADLLGDQHPEDLGGVPALGPGGGEDVGGGGAQVGQPHPAQHARLEGVGQWRWRVVVVDRHRGAPSGSRWRTRPSRRCRAAAECCSSATTRWRWVPPVIALEGQRWTSRSPSANRPAVAATAEGGVDGARCPTRAASSTAAAIFDRTRCAPTAAASTSQACAPGPMRQERRLGGAAGPRLRRPGARRGPADGRGSATRSIRGLPGVDSRCRATSTQPRLRRSGR